MSVMDAARRAAARPTYKELVAENERLRAALKPFSDAVYNDNGDMTITPCGMDAYRKVYFVMRRDQQTGDKA